VKIFPKEELSRIQNPTPGQRHRLNVLTEADNAKALAGHFSVLFPGGDVPYHYHEKRECLIFIVDGQIVEIVEGKEYPVQAGDTIFIPAGERHKMENRTDRDARYVEFFTPIDKDFIEIK
jgi:quercetin dioxygenase-like cupin family protein